MTTLLDNIEPTIDPNKDYLPELIGEGGKFHKPDQAEALKALARGKVESDNYITTLERQLDSMRSDFIKAKDDATARANLQDLVDQLAKARQSGVNNEPPVNQEAKPSFDPSQLESLVSSKIQEHEASKRQQENFEAVKVKLKERFGDNYPNVLKEQMVSLGLTETDINDLARNKPMVLIKSLGLDTPRVNEQFQPPARGTQRSDQFAPQGAQKRTLAFYERMRQESPKQYYDPKTTVQMHNDAQALGWETFNDVSE